MEGIWRVADGAKAYTEAATTAHVPVRGGVHTTHGGSVDAGVAEVMGEPWQRVLGRGPYLR